MAFLNLTAIRECTEAEGPGKRFAIWCQGCPRSCPGCCNKKMQEFSRRYIVDTKDVISLIEKSLRQNEIEGVTFIGGEPMLQAEGFAEIAEWCHNYKLSVIVFSGFLYKELREMDNPSVDKLLKNSDVLVDGPFIQEEFDTERDWIGSKNQKVYFLTDFYKPGIEYEHNEHAMEIMISEKDLLINGWPFAITGK
jgi:anaerobic ribonucleoside-triphosphate reductase activating protein